MISIIVSTYKPDNFKQFCENVKKTIGSLDYEIISINNPGIMGLCEAYNRGIIKAKYNYLCFCHDDIIFHTENWGNILISLFIKDKEIGLIGCAGSSYKSWTPSGWSTPQSSELVKTHLIQTYSYGRTLRYISEKDEDYETVVTLDGFFLCTTKSITNQFQFDSKTFKGYHVYDVDFALQVNTKYKIVVCYNILIEHFSEGSFSKEWLQETYKLHKKWGKLFPISNELLSKKEIRIQESRAFVNLMNKTFDFNFSYFKFAKVLFSFKLLSLTGFICWFDLLLKTIGVLFNKFVRGK